MPIVRISEPIPTRPHPFAGVDEAGRGPLAGPVAVAAVILDPSRPIPGLDDSKALSEKKRDALFPLIQERALCYHIERVTAEEVDRLNILAASLLGMSRALAALSVRPEWAGIDGPHLPPSLCCPADAIIKGDARHPAIAAASILAKVARDQWMQELDALYPGYGFARHKGYGTRVHLDALHRLGPCPEHRKTFAPVAACRPR